MTGEMRRDDTDEFHFALFSPLRSLWMMPAPFVVRWYHIAAVRLVRLVRHG